MGWLGAGISAAAVIWILNTWVFNRSKGLSVLLVMPFFEETAKTGFALFFGSNLLLVHGLFGAIEGIYELYRDNRIDSTLVACFTHLGFGLLTAGIYGVFHHWLLAILGASIIHALWNYCVVRFFGHTSEGGKVR